MLGQIKTVNSVFDEFTAKLKVVTEQHQQRADKAVKVRERLLEATETQEDIIEAAEAEVAKAMKGIKNFGEMFGITTEG